MNRIVHQLHRSLLLSTAAIASYAFACSDAETSGGGGAGTDASTAQTTSATSGATKATTASASSGQDPFAACKKGELEDDFVEQVPLSGPGVDAETGELAPGTYHVSSTYLAVIPDQMQRALDLGGAVIGSLQSAQGLVAFSIAGSQSCVALRTLTVWESEEDMVAFVVSAPHATAMQATPEISRGTGNTIAWEGDETTATWEEGAARLGAEIGGDL